MNDNIFETEEENKTVENSLKIQETDINNVERSSNNTASTHKNLVKIGDNVVDVKKYKATIETYKNMIAYLEVPYDDLTVLVEDTDELRVVTKFFSDISCEDEEIETLLYETIGYGLFRNATLNKAIIYLGCGRNGKSKIFRILEALAPKQCSHEHLEQLCPKNDSKSTIKKLSNSTVNISEDQIQPRYINTSYLTRLIAGEPISIEEKGKRVFPSTTFTNYATLVFSMNEVIRFKQEVGISLTDRFIIIPFNATFTDDNNNRDINIGKKLCQPKALQIIATRAIFEILKVLKKGKFTIPDSVKQETERYFMQDNNALEFCNLFKIKTFIGKTAYYTKYDDWCHKNLYEPLNIEQFGKQVLALGYRSERFSLDDKRIYYYVSSSFDSNNRSSVYQEFKKQKDVPDFQEYLWKQIEEEAKIDDTPKTEDEQATQEESK